MSTETVLSIGNSLQQELKSAVILDKFSISHINPPPTVKLDVFCKLDDKITIYVSFHPTGR